MTCVMETLEEIPLRKNPSPFSPPSNACENDFASMTRELSEGHLEGQKTERADSMWLSRRMADEGCTLGQTLLVMEDRCRCCNAISPLLCLEECSTWEVKKELNQITNVISKPGHALRLLNAVKNRRRLEILRILRDRPLAISVLQKKLRSRGFRHSRKTVRQYVKPLLQVGLVRENNKRFDLTIYGRKINDIAVMHRFSGQLPPRSNGYEEKVVRSLLGGAKTRSELANGVPRKSLSRILKRLREAKLISGNSSSAHVFYFRTKRALSLERLTPTQKRICESIPQAGIPAPELSRLIGINLRRTYKYLRGLRGKKLLFRRNIPTRHELTSSGQAAAEFLEEIAHIA